LSTVNPLMSSGLHQFSAHAWLSISARDVHARLQSEQADGRDRLRPLRLREISDLAFLKAEQRLRGCWRKDTLGDAGPAIRRAPLPYVETGIENWKVASFCNGRLNATYGLFAPRNRCGRRKAVGRFGGLACSHISVRPDGPYRRWGIVNLTVR